MNQVSGFFPAIVLSFGYEIEIKEAKSHFVRDPLSPRESVCWIIMALQRMQLLVPKVR